MLIFQPKGEMRRTHPAFWLKAPSSLWPTPCPTWRSPPCADSGLPPIHARARSGGRERNEDGAHAGVFRAAALARWTPGSAIYWPAPSPKWSIRLRAVRLHDGVLRAFAILCRVRCAPADSAPLAATLTLRRYSQRDAHPWTRRMSCAAQPFVQMDDALRLFLHLPF